MIYGQTRNFRFKNFQFAFRRPPPAHRRQVRDVLRKAFAHPRPIITRPGDIPQDFAPVARHPLDLIYGHRRKRHHAPHLRPKSRRAATTAHSISPIFIAAASPGIRPRQSRAAFRRRPGSIARWNEMRRRGAGQAAQSGGPRRFAENAKGRAERGCHGDAFHFLFARLTQPSGKIIALFYTRNTKIVGAIKIVRF